MYDFKGFTDKDFEMSKLSAGATISIFVFVMMIVLGLLLG